jgi:hypothetical protein
LSQNEVIQQPLNLRCLALTGAFETNCLPPGCFACVTGDFDGQGISFSALQWNLGQGTLQLLLAEMNSTHATVMRQVFGEDHEQLTGMLAGTRASQMGWARTIQTPRNTLQEPWATRFQSLGMTAEFQSVATQRAADLYNGALALCRTLGLHSQRAAALMFDIKIQNGGIGPSALTQIEKDFAAIAPGDQNVVEVARMRNIANRIADSSNPRWREDVRSRKLAIANGMGVVHGMHYDLAAQFGLTLSDWNAV